MTRSDPSTSYDDDFYAWTQAQAAAVRRLPVGIGGIDIDHLAEEIEALGKRDLREVESYLLRLIEHLVKIDVCAGSRDLPHWRSEARHFQRSARVAFAPSMRQLLDIDGIWDAAQKLMIEHLSDQGIEYLPIACPFALDDLLSSDFDMKAALTRIASAKGNV